MRNLFDLDRDRRLLRRRPDLAYSGQRRTPRPIPVRHDLDSLWDTVPAEAQTLPARPRARRR